MSALVTLAQVEAFLSSPVVVDTLDDDNDGTIDIVAKDQVIADASALFMANARGIYETPFTAPIDPFVVTVILSLVHCQLVKRFPERFRAGLKVCEDAKELLKGIRDGELVLDHPRRSETGVPSCDSYEARGYEALEPTRDAEDE